MSAPATPQPRIETDAIAYTAPNYPRGAWLVRITCPFCGKRHTHGAGPADQRPRAEGWRKAHCSARVPGGPAEYFIVDDQALIDEAVRR